MKIFAFFFGGLMLVSGWLGGQNVYTVGDTVRGKELLNEAKTLIDSARYDAALGKLDTAEVIFGETAGREDTMYARVLHQKGRCFYFKGNYARAIEHYQEALEIRLKKLGVEHLDVAASYNNLGIAYFRIGDYERAIGYHQKALEIRLKKLGVEHLDVAGSYFSLGLAYQDKGEPDNAIEYHKKALEIQLKKFGDEHPDVADSYNYLGDTYYYKGNYDQTIEYLQKALEIRLKKFGDEYPNLVRSYNDLGIVYLNKGDYQHAIEYYQKALEIRLKKLGDEHPDVATSYTNIGVAYERKGDYERAIECHQKALETCLKKFGDEHISVAWPYNNMGVAYERKGDYDRAIENHKKALESRIKKYGTEHSDVATSYNNLGVAFGLKGDYELAIEYHQKALAIRLKKLGGEHPDVAASYNNLGNGYGLKGDYQHAIEYYQKALEIRLKIFGVEHPDIATSYNNLGVSYEKKDDYARAIEYHKKALEIRLIKFGAEHLEVAGSYNNLGNVYSNKGDFDRSIEYYQKSLEINLKKIGTEHPDLAGYYNNLGAAYGLKGDINSEIEFHQKALAIRLKKLGGEHPDVAATYNNLGIGYGLKGDKDRSIECHQKALEIKLRKLGTEHPDVAAAYINLGAAYFEKGDCDGAIEYQQKALSITLKKLGAEHSKVATSYSNLGVAFGFKGDYDRAIEYHQKALEIRLKKIGTEHPDVADSYVNFVKLYKSKGNYSQSIGYLKKASTSITACRKNFENPDSKFTLAKVTAVVCEDGIAVNRILHRLTDSLHFLHNAFDFAEQSQALYLYESIQKADALHISGIPDSLLQQEYDLRIDITYNKNRRQKLLEEGKHETDTTVLAISNKIFDLNRQSETLLHHFETTYPDYYRLKHDLTTITVQQLQDSLLHPDQTLLEYFVGDSSLFIFVINKDDYQVVEVKKDFPLEDWVRQMREGITGYWGIRSSERPENSYETTSKQYGEAARNLYEKLLAPVDSLLARRVVIVPDGVLGYLPFEALLTQPPPERWERFHLYSYFGLEHTVSYCYSATLLREMTERQHRQPPAKNCLAVAPLFASISELRKDDEPDPKPRLRSLPGALEEARTINKIMGGDTLIGKEAVERAFSDTAAGYRIVHLASHAVASDKVGEYCYVAFTEVEDSLENELLYVGEVYNLPLNADLVTISACETGIGELRRGEGIISLARAFAYAGAKSIVTSLWTASDEATKDLMIYFYKNLQKGMSKDEALAEAKRTFLQGDENGKRGEPHPYFWAGFVGIGDMEPLQF